MTSKQIAWRSEETMKIFKWIKLERKSFVATSFKKQTIQTKMVNEIFQKTKNNIRVTW